MMLDLRSSSLQATWVQNGMEIPAPASNIFDIFPSAYAVPLEVKKFYKAFDDKIITNLYDASVAQTVRELSVGRNGRATAL